MPRLRSLMITSLTAATALLALALPASASTRIAGPPTARAGAASPMTTTGSNDYLNGNSCTSATFCMAVGSYDLGIHFPGLSEMLSGGTWVAEPVPSPSHGVNVFANEVSCASSSRCLFVGDHYAGPKGNGWNLAEAWNGSSWHIVTTTGPAGTTSSGLDDVACPSTTFCLAVGWAGTTGTRYQDTAYTWSNGSRWRRIAVPRPRLARNSQLVGLACFSARNCVAIGDYTSASGRYLSFAAHWQSGRWRLLSTPTIRGQRYEQFEGVSCPTATRCVAVGYTEDNTRGRFYHAFAEVWSGGRWHISTVRRSPSVFSGTSCPGWNRCFATGYVWPPGATYAHPLIMTWNGVSWSAEKPVQTSAPNVASLMQHVSCVTRSHCVAVGYSFNPSANNSDQTLAEMWNGHTWALQTTVNP